MRAGGGHLQHETMERKAVIRPSRCNFRHSGREKRHGFMLLLLLSATARARRGPRARAAGQLARQPPRKQHESRCRGQDRRWRRRRRRERNLCLSTGRSVRRPIPESGISGRREGLSWARLTVPGHRKGQVLEPARRSRVSWRWGPRTAAAFPGAGKVSQGLNRWFRAPRACLPFSGSRSRAPGRHLNGPA